MTSQCTVTSIQEMEPLHRPEMPMPQIAGNSSLEFAQGVTVPGGGERSGWERLRHIATAVAPIVACLALASCRASDDGLGVRGGDTIKQLKRDAPVSQQEDQDNGSGNTVRRNLTGGQARDSKRGSGKSGGASMWEKARQRAGRSGSN